MSTKARASRFGWGISGFTVIGLATILSFGPLGRSLAAEPVSTDKLEDTAPPSMDIPLPPPSASPVVLEGGEAGSILGREVRSAADEKLGRIIDVIVDRRGTTRAAVIDFGGFLGVGSRKIAVAWDILTFSVRQSGEDRIVVQTTRDRLNTAPEFKEGKPITVLGANADAADTKVTLKASE